MLLSKIKEYKGKFNKNEENIISALHQHKSINYESFLNQAANQEETDSAIYALHENGIISCDLYRNIILDQDELDIFRKVSMNLEQYCSLIDKAIQTQKNTWSPYSNFGVGAAICTNQGKITTGTNMENAAYGGTICAERVAAGSALAKGDLNPEKSRFIEAIAIVLPIKDFGRPCGQCAQVIYEFSDPGDHAIVLMANSEHEAMVRKITHVLPYAFGPQDIGLKIEPSFKTYR